MFVKGRERAGCDEAAPPPPPRRAGDTQAPKMTTVRGLSFFRDRRGFPPLVLSTVKCICLSAVCSRCAVGKSFVHPLRTVSGCQRLSAPNAFVPTPELRQRGCASAANELRSPEIKSWPCSLSLHVINITSVHVNSLNRV